MRFQDHRSRLTPFVASTLVPVVLRGNEQDPPLLLLLIPQESREF